MKDKDYGIIISKIDYSESSYILKVFTSKNGLSSFLFKGAKKKKGQTKIYPLAIVELEYSLNPKSDLQFLSSVETYVNTSHSFFNPIKSSILFFLNEVLQKTLKSNEANVELMAFLISRLKYLDLDEKPANFHIYFLLDYSKYLGFYPDFDLTDSKQMVFDQKEGLFLRGKPNHEFFVEGREALAIRAFLGTKFDTERSPDLNGIKRIRILEIITDYYKLQIEDFGTCKTLEILETIFND